MKERLQNLVLSSMKISVTVVWHIPFLTFILSSLKTTWGPRKQCYFGFYKHHLNDLLTRWVLYCFRRNWTDLLKGGIRRDTVVQWCNATNISTVPSQKKGPGFDSGLVCFCVEFACSPCLFVGSLRCLQFPPTVQKHENLGVRLIGHFKLL